MTEYFYDKQDKIIRKTSETYNFYIKYWKDEYKSFMDYMNTVFPDFVLIDNYSEV